MPDPGLREYGGHHPAMVNAIANTPAAINGDIQLNVFCNKNCSDEFINKTKSKQVEINKHFATDFYEYFYKDPSLVSINTYINQLTKEYLNVFEQCSEELQSAKSSLKIERTIFLYHTLNWEHATALASAIDIYNKHHCIPLNHCVFLMFNPIKYNEKGHLKNRQFLNFKLGFSLLAKQKCVQYYASEIELQQNYQFLLFNDNQSNNEDNRLKKIEYNDQIKKIIPIHPCGLVGQDSGNDNIKKNREIILFTGDAKANKGFLTLPSLVKKLTKNIIEKDVKFIIQYTITNDEDVLRQVDISLQSLAKSDERIKLINRFWSHSELHQHFAKAACIVFNYDSSIYKNQSSGMLWLAAYYRLNMIFLTTNWLKREAERLECQYTICSDDDLSQKVRKYVMQNNHYFNEVPTSKYRELLFQDIGAWLLKM